jgi:hypothetical protein
MPVKFEGRRIRERLSQVKLNDGLAVHIREQKLPRGSGGTAIQELLFQWSSPKQVNTKIAEIGAFEVQIPEEGCRFIFLCRKIANPAYVDRAIFERNIGRLNDSTTNDVRPARTSVSSAVIFVRL